MQNVPTKIIVHHSASPRDTTTVFDIDTWHKQRGFLLSRRGYHVGYHLVIDGAGLVAKTKDYDEEGCHTIGENTRSIGICLTGNFDEESPSDEQYNALGKVLIELTDLYKIQFSEIFPHRKFAPKSCYGSLLPDNWAQGCHAKARLELLKSNQINNIMDEGKPALYELKDKETGEIKIVVPHTFGDGFVLYAPVIGVVRSNNEDTYVRFENPDKDVNTQTSEKYEIKEVK